MGRPAVRGGFEDADAEGGDGRLRQRAGRPFPMVPLVVVRREDLGLGVRQPKPVQHILQVRQNAPEGSRHRGRVDPVASGDVEERRRHAHGFHGRPEVLVRHPVGRGVADDAAQEGRGA